MVEEQGAEQAEPDQERNSIRKRARTKIEFPYSDLSRSEELCAAQLEIAGKAEAEQTQLAVKLDMSANGGTFRGRLSAARMFGLIVVSSGKLQLTDLGLQILEPQTRAMARAAAFLNIELYAAMYERYNGYSLPPAAAIERQMEELGVPPKQTERARQAFAASAETANYISENGRFSKPAVGPPLPDSPREEKAEEKPNGGGGGTGDDDGGSGDDDRISDKALEYKLVDLMRESEIGEEERKAIWTLIQYLTAKQKKREQDNPAPAADSERDEFGGL